jgi:hypothetical protein
MRTVPQCTLTGVTEGHQWPSEHLLAFRRFIVRVVVCVKFSKLVMVTGCGLNSGREQHPFVRSKTTIPSSRPALRQSAAGSFATELCASTDREALRDDRPPRWRAHAVLRILRADSWAWRAANFVTATA